MTYRENRFYECEKCQEHVNSLFRRLRALYVDRVRIVMISLETVLNVQVLQEHLAIEPESKPRVWWSAASYWPLPQLIRLLGAGAHVSSRPTYLAVSLHNGVVAIFFLWSTTVSNIPNFDVVHLYFACVKEENIASQSESDDNLKLVEREII